MIKTKQTIRLPLSLIFPAYLVFVVIGDLGELTEKHIITKDDVFTAIFVSFGLWLVGYITGKLENK